jgi:predicted house-cleaning noncanonical NTP pyrophosphatase (MazG superfamily)
MKFIKKNPEPIEFIRWKEQEKFDEKIEAKLEQEIKDILEKKMLEPYCFVKASHWNEAKQRMEQGSN